MTSSYSVVMAVFNGQDFLFDQLESIRLQTLKPTEVIIFDDCSTDSSVEIIREFISRYSLPNWKLKINETNLGWRKNFYVALTHANEEYVFLSDQDDIWELDKCERMIKFMQRQRSCKLLMSNYRAFSEDREIKIPYPMLIQSNSKRFKKHGSKVACLLTVFRPGCTYCVRRDFLNSIFGIWIEGVAHDMFIYHQSIINDSAFLFNYRAIHFRRHKNNNSPIHQRTKRARLNEITESLELIKEYKKNVGDLSTESLNRVLLTLETAEKLQIFRLQFFNNPGFRSVIQLVKCGINNYPSIRNFIGDLIIGFCQTDNVHV